MSLRLRRDSLLHRSAARGRRRCPQPNPDGSREHGGHKVCTGIGVPEDLARFELLAALEQDVDEPTAKLRVLLP
jgi:hypothetical protein